MTNLTSGTSYRKVFANLGAYAFDQQGTRHLDYVGLNANTVQGDGRVHELYLSGSGLHLGGIDNGSFVIDQFSSVAGYSFAQNPPTQHVDVRLGSPGPVLELWWDGDWHQNKIGSASGAPDALTGPYGFPFGFMQAVCYRAGNSHPIVLWWAQFNGWKLMDLTQTGASIALGDVVGYAEPPAAPGSEALAHFVYVGADSLEMGRLHHVFRDATGSWHDDSGSVPQLQVLNSVRPAGLVDAAGIHHVFCAAPVDPKRIGGPTYLHEFARDRAGNWTQNIITPPGTRGPHPDATLSAYEFIDQGTIHVPYPTDNGEFYDSWWSSHLGWTVQVLGANAAAPLPIGGAVGYVSTKHVQGQPVTSQFIDYRDGDRDAIELSWSALETVAPQVADVSGEGNLDVVAFGDDGVWIALGDGQGNFDDPFLALANFGFHAGSWQVANHQRTVADLTGERRGDIVGFGDAGVWTAMSRPGGTLEDAVLALNDFGYDQGWRVKKHVRLLADLDGNDAADIVGFGDAGVYVAFSNLDGTFRMTPVPVVPDLGYDQGWRDERHPRMVGSLRYPGSSDLVGFGDAGVYVAMNDGVGNFTFTPVPAIPDFGYDAGGWRVDRHPRFVATLTQSGHGDIVGFADDGVWTALGNGDGTFQVPRLVLGDFGYQAGGWRVEKHVRLLTDVNGDGLADIVGFGEAGVYVALSDGQGGFQQPLAVLWLGDLAYDQGWRLPANPRVATPLAPDGKLYLLGFDQVGLRLAVSLPQQGRFSDAWAAGFDFGYVPRAW